MRAAILHGPGDLRIEEVAEPAGEVVVELRAATSSRADREALAQGHGEHGGAPVPLGREMAGERHDTGERVLVGDSLPCGACAPCRAGRTNLCKAMTWIVGGFAERIAVPEAVLHPVPNGLPFAAAAMASELAAGVHAVGRGTDEREVTVLGGGTTGLMLARLLVLDGREVTVVDRHAERRAQAEELGARGADGASGAPLVFAAAAGPEGWHDAIAMAGPGATVVLVGACPPAAGVPLPGARLHDEEVDVRGAFHHTPGEVDEALLLLSTGAIDHGAFAGRTIGLDELPEALAAPEGGEARKLVVDPQRGAAATT